MNSAPGRICTKVIKGCREKSASKPAAPGKGGEPVATPPIARLLLITIARPMAAGKNISTCSKREIRFMP